MARHLSQPELDKFLRKEVSAKGKSQLDSLLKAKRPAPVGRIKEKSIFLSHSHHDKTIIAKIALLFDKIDIGIYVDWMDHSLPSFTNKETAASIKRKIQHCNRFLFLATSRAMTSKWCDWELGIAYSLKKESEIAVLPVVPRSGNWKGSEYLQLFPELRIDTLALEHVDARNVYIYYSEDKAVPLQQWFH